MPVAGKKKTDWEVRTYCDFGTPPRKEVLRSHFSISAALRAYKEIEKIYGPNSLTKSKSRVWQETREGKILNDNRNQS